ncbi:MAG: glycoside hydrolase family 3 C-terminal domain-containing protein [Woeseiaceae bacterium]
MRLKLLAMAIIGICLQFGPASAAEDSFPWEDENLDFGKRASVLVQAMTLDEKIAQLSRSTPAIPRLNVPEYDWWNEALHGIARNGKATIFPQVIGLAATFDPELAYRMADAISTEARAKFNLAQSMGNRGQYAGLTFWTPNVNIFRDPRWGRGQETYGESPYLSSLMGVEFVRGLQGTHPTHLKTAAAAKHFAVHSGPEADRHHFDVHPDKKDLYETYLPAFESLVRSGVAGVMCAYNAVYGDPSCASSFLLQDLLKDEWGFEGYIVSDCGALGDIHKGHKMVGTAAEAAAIALEKGINLNCGDTFQKLGESLEQGLVTEQLIDERLVELLTIRFRLGLFDAPGSNPWDEVGTDAIHSDEHVALAREIATKSIVLLKNDNNTLPLKKDIRVPYVTGPFASSSDILMANYYGVSGDMVTVLEGIANKISLASSLNYRMGVLPFHENINPLNYAPYVARTADATIAVVGISADMEGEEVDAIASRDKGDRVNLELPESQAGYIREIAEMKTGPLILVVAAGSPVALGDLYDLADAVLYMWYPGEQGGNAVADVIFGDANPSGHLPLTFPKSVKQLPPYSEYSMEGRTYKYMEQEPLFPFGFGLSFTSFEYRELDVSLRGVSKGESLQISLGVANTGKVNGSDLVQVYLSPLDPAPGEARFALKTFERVNVSAGSTTRVELSIPAAELYRFDAGGEKVKLAGRYMIHVGNSLPTQRSLDLGAPTPLSQVIDLTE